MAVATAVAIVGTLAACGNDDADSERSTITKTKTTDQTTTKTATTTTRTTTPTYDDETTTEEYTPRQTYTPHNKHQRKRRTRAITTMKTRTRTSLTLAWTALSWSGGLSAHSAPAWAVNSTATTNRSNQPRATAEMTATSTTKPWSKLRDKKSSSHVRTTLYDESESHGLKEGSHVTAGHTVEN